MNVGFVTLCALLLIGCDRQQTWQASPDRSPGRPAASSGAPSGTGYADLEGTALNYTYEDFGGFQVTVHDGKIKWRGVEGYFTGISREVVPQISKVADKVYFSSWSTGGNGGDNVVFNFNSMEVNAHLNPDASNPETLQMIHGVIHCWKTPDCAFPDGELTPNEDVFPSIEKNMAARNLPPLFDPDINNLVRSAADHGARAELAGLAIQFDTPHGPTRIEVDGDETRVNEGQGDAQSFRTYATKIDEGIYFVSWLGDLGGNHIVVNRQSMKVFDHISPAGERAEAIYDVTCFDPVANC